MTTNILPGPIETQSRDKLLSLRQDGKSDSGIFSNGKLYATVSTKNKKFELSKHTHGDKKGLSMGLIHGPDGIQEHLGFIEITPRPGQVDIGGIYHISRHLDYLSAQTQQINRSLEAIRAKQEEVLEHLHNSTLASLRQSGCDFMFALKNLDTISEHNLQSTYTPAIASGIQAAEKVIHEKALLWEDRLKFSERNLELWQSMPEEIENSIYFKSLFVTSVGHASQALLSDGNMHLVALSRLKISELASPIYNILHRVIDKKEQFYNRLLENHKTSDSRGLYGWNRLSPEDEVESVIDHALRLIEALDYLKNLSFVDCVQPGRTHVVLEISDDLQEFSTTQPMVIPDALKKLSFKKDSA
ncbi:hypothetical protein [Pseudomonas savastanoi]|uniref:Uncharacterized protein n=1 Tax=Pseudomonas savastanoi TaxID=29438 RepID=A0A3M5FN99_PSESS|nr:hypothetical protein [Pseudomonas savastanoi]RMS75113.1 hypothetical protein ALP59_03662 [Pseudomonas savastanoi]